MVRMLWPTIGSTHAGSSLWFLYSHKIFTFNYVQHIMYQETFQIKVKKIIHNLRCQPDFCAVTRLWIHVKVDCTGRTQIKIKNRRTCMTAFPEKLN